MPKPIVPRNQTRQRPSSTHRNAPNPRLAEDSLAVALLGAARLVAAVTAGRSLASVEPAPLAPAVRDLAYGTLRDYGRGDFLLRRLLLKPLPSVPLRALLLVALHRLEHRPDAAHTLVDQAVTAAGTFERASWRGLANGVLRNFLRRRETLLADAELDELARWRHPSWWLARLRRDHPDDWQAIAAAGNVQAPMSLRVNVRRTGVTEVLQQYEAAGIPARAAGSVGLRLERARPTAALPGFEEGRISVQDLGAQRAAELLDLAAGQRVLDACAAPGGKSGHILERAAVVLTALDASATRLETVAANLTRLGLAARLLAADCRRLEHWWDGVGFERILADVPCSASGVVRRHPDAKWLRREADITRFAAEQAAILEALWRTLAPGGKLLYATCSVFAEENQRQVEQFLAGHGESRLIPIDGRPYLQLLPSAEHDGFFYALLEKRP